jgi:hypothetical protein
MADDFNAAADLANGDELTNKGSSWVRILLKKRLTPRLALARLRASLMTFVSLKYTG